MAEHEGERTGVSTRLLIVPPQEIPPAVTTPTDDLMALYKLSSRMKVLCKQENGKGLSAVQVGVPWDLFVVAEIPKHIRHNDDPWGTYVGCNYTTASDSKNHDSIEGCLSLKDSQGRVRRYKVSRLNKIRVRGYRLIDTPGLALEEIDYILDLRNDAIVFQHEIDHHRGILISQIGEEVLLWK